MLTLAELFFFSISCPFLNPLFHFFSLSIEYLFFFLTSCLLLAHVQLLVFWLVEAIGQTTLATIMSIQVAGHTNSSTAFIWRALSAKVTDFAILVHFVVFQDSQLNLLALTLTLLGSGVRLRPFLSATMESQHKMKRGLLLNTVVRQSTSIFRLLASKDQSLLIRRNSFLILDLGLYIFCRIRGFNLESDGLPHKGFHENLHIGGDSTADGGSERALLNTLSAKFNYLLKWFIDGITSWLFLKEVIINSQKPNNFNIEVCFFNLYVVLPCLFSLGDHLFHTFHMCCLEGQ